MNGISTSNESELQSSPEISVAFTRHIDEFFRTRFSEALERQDLPAARRVFDLLSELEQTQHRAKLDDLRTDYRNRLQKDQATIQNALTRAKKILAEDPKNGNWPLQAQQALKALQTANESIETWQFRPDTDDWLEQQEQVEALREELSSQFHAAKLYRVRIVNQIWPLISEAPVTGPSEMPSGLPQDLRPPAAYHHDLLRFINSASSDLLESFQDDSQVGQWSWWQSETAKLLQMPPLKEQQVIDSETPPVQQQTSVRRTIWAWLRLGAAVFAALIAVVVVIGVIVWLTVQPVSPSQFLASLFPPASSTSPTPTQVQEIPIPVETKADQPQEPVTATSVSGAVSETPRNLEDTEPEITSPEEDTGGEVEEDSEVITSDTDSENSDADEDGLLDDDEINEYHTDPDKSDTDGDKLLDGEEIENYKTDPTLTDTDSDTLSDHDEVKIHRTDPNDPDTDGDDLTDGTEFATGKDPLVKTSSFSFPPEEATYPVFPWQIVLTNTLPASVTLQLEPVAPIEQIFTVTLSTNQEEIRDNQPLILSSDLSRNQGEGDYIYSWTRTVRELKELPEGHYRLRAYLDTNGDGNPDEERYSNLTLDPNLAVPAKVVRYDLFGAIFRDQPFPETQNNDTIGNDAEVSVLGRLERVTTEGEMVEEPSESLEFKARWCLYENKADRAHWWIWCEFLPEIEGREVPLIAPVEIVSEE